MALLLTNSRHTDPSSAYTFGTLPCFLPGGTNRVASQAFSRSALMKFSTPRSQELSADSLATVKSAAFSEDRLASRSSGYGPLLCPNPTGNPACDSESYPEW